jgi:serine/threonine protein kinase
MDNPPAFLRAKYSDVQYLDTGGYGRVYKCAREGKNTAVKILDKLHLEAQRRFQSEIEILRRVSHENVVKIYDAGETDGYYWYESEYAQYDHFGKMQGYLFYSDLDRVNYFRQICLGVQALHNLEPPIIHRDIKPSNILVFEYSEQKMVLKIADLGLATIVGESIGITKTGTVPGTAHYIAPERDDNPRIKTPQSDIYSLGITFLEACTGRTRPSQDNLNLVPEIIRPIIEKMVREHPRERYQSIAEILNAFDDLSSWHLFTGRDEKIVHVAHVNIGRELENALEFLYKCDSENVLVRLDAFERTLDRLGQAHDHKAITLMNVPRQAMALIDNADKDASLRLVQRFIKATELTRDTDFFSPDPESWSRFLSNTYAAVTYRATKHLCLEGLVAILVRFKRHGTKAYLYQTIKSIEDPSYIGHLVTCLREAGYEDIAEILEGVPDQRDLNLEALEAALRSIN